MKKTSILYKILKETQIKKSSCLAAACKKLLKHFVGGESVNNLNIYGNLVTFYKNTKKYCEQISVTNFWSLLIVQRRRKKTKVWDFSFI